MLFSYTLDIQEELEQTKVEQLWTLEFDGPSCANVGSGARVVLTSPSGETTFLAYKLDFKNTKNTKEY